MKVFIVIWFFVLLSCSSLVAQNNKIVIGEFQKIHSKVLDADKNIMVYLPAQYRATKTKYSVIYLLDGPDHFHHMTGILQFLSQRGVMPDMIVIAISNFDRTHDLTPETDSTDILLATAGGADIFLQFLIDELMPYVQKKYRTDPYKILIGHSFGGLFAVHTMLNKPDAFDAYISISPSLWWNRWEEVKHAESFFRSHPSFKKSLYITLGNEGPEMQDPMNSFVSIMEKVAPHDFRWKYDYMSKEDHGTTVHRSIYDGLEWLYAGWAYPHASVKTGLVGLEQHYSRLSEKFGYPMEPSESIINTVGYELLANTQFAEAIKVFQYNITKNPESANVYDSLADAYESIDEMELALKNRELAYAQGKKNSDPALSLYQKRLESLKKKMGKRN